MREEQHNKHLKKINLKVIEKINEQKIDKMRKGKIIRKDED